MTARWITLPLAAAVLLVAAGGKKNAQPQFQTSDRCLACHNGLQTSAGQDVSIGYDWRATMMANSSRDPYWHAGVRRETIDHPESQAEIEDECSVCHMPITRYEAMLAGHKGQVFAHLPFEGNNPAQRPAQDGVSCSVCHQITKRKLGTRESFNGGFVVDPPDAAGNRTEYGPFAVDPGHQTIMRSSSEGYKPVESAHIRDSELCATCHTLYTKALGPGGKVVGELPEQMPYQEWLHSEYRETRSCQSCHMPAVPEPVRITQVLGEPRAGVRRHTFVASNFFMLRMLNRFRADLGVTALPDELNAAAERTVEYLQTQAARLTIEQPRIAAGRLEADLVVENLGGHKLPTAYPSRRAWLHITVRDAAQRTVFESGALNADGSIRGNDNDADPARFEPHYSTIQSPDQVEIYEAIMGGADGKLTTGLLTAVRYLKDNRLLPHGFNKQTAAADVAVVGEALTDANFTGAGDRVHLAIPVPAGNAPYEITAELLYQPIAYRWANNLKAYASAAEPRRFNSYYDAMSSATAIPLVRQSATGIR